MSVSPLDGELHGGRSSVCPDRCYGFGYTEGRWLAEWLLAVSLTALRGKGPDDREQLREAPAVGGVCIRGQQAGLQQGCGGGNESGLGQRRWGDQPALLGEGVVTLAGYGAGGIQVPPPGASLPLYTALGLPQLPVIPPSSRYLLL